jgi:hypothetical protein
MNTATTFIQQTANWINSVVIGCNFCPFAAKAVLRQSIRYVVLPGATVESSLETVITEMQFLDQSDDIETTLIIFPDSFAVFEDYLDLVELAEATRFGSGLRWHLPGSQFSSGLLFCRCTTRMIPPIIPIAPSIPCCTCCGKRALRRPWKIFRIRKEYPTAISISRGKKG